MDIATLTPLYGWFTEGFDTAELAGSQSTARGVGVRIDNARFE
jgi:hypothetical protein